MSDHLLSQRVLELNESTTLKLNAKAIELAESGKQIFNLTAGQLPLRPCGEFVDRIKDECSFLKSFQYSPVPGFPELRKKVLESFHHNRRLRTESSDFLKNFDVCLSNGGKHALTNVFGAFLNPNDEVIILAPYWTSYPEMVGFFGGKSVYVHSTPFDAFVPALSDIEQAINDQTKMIVINSPNNPSGIHYSDLWMQQFGELLLKYPQVMIVSDEIYWRLSYYDPAPTFFYQHFPELLERTLVVDGISKSLASTGLRLGHCLGPKWAIEAISKIQGQTTSGANSLIQRAYALVEEQSIEEFMMPVLAHLRGNAGLIKEKLRTSGLSPCWYQITSAFYFLIDFSSTPLFQRYSQDRKAGKDYSQDICEYILEESGVALVPGVAFGVPNTGRLSIVLEQKAFEMALDKLIFILLKS